MRLSELLPSALIGAVAGARSMTPMASIAAARFLGDRTPGRLVLLERPTLVARQHAMARMGQTRSGLILG